MIKRYLAGVGFCLVGLVLMGICTTTGGTRSVAHYCGGITGVTLVGVGLWFLWISWGEYLRTK